MQLWGKESLFPTNSNMSEISRRGEKGTLPEYYVFRALTVKKQLTAPITEMRRAG
jgi:hypothetical protein